MKEKYGECAAEQGNCQSHLICMSQFVLHYRMHVGCENSCVRVCTRVYLRMSTRMCTPWTQCSTCNCQPTISDPCRTIRSLYYIWFTQADRKSCGALFSCWKELHLLCKETHWNRDLRVGMLCVHLGVCFTWQRESPGGRDFLQHVIYTHTKAMPKEGIR